MTSFERICDEIVGNAEPPIETVYDLETCTPMIDKKSGKNRLVVYLPLDDANQPTPEGIGEAVIELIEAHDYSAKFSSELDGQAVVTSE